ncbi:MAG TPA: S8 family serine peptidase [Luteibaculaceae bacterium]|nr:S8 family serine peptidase [Luteibaculaceae bacterium]
MKKRTHLIAPLLIAGAALSFGSCSKDNLATDPVSTSTSSASKIQNPTLGNEYIADQYIVTMNSPLIKTAIDGITNYDLRNEALVPFITQVLDVAGIDSKNIGSVYNTVFFGFSVKATAEQINRLAASPLVSFIEQDQVMRVLGQVDAKAAPANLKAQTVNYGVTRVGSGSGTGKRAWVLDTGIDLDHPDLNVNRTLSKSFISSGGGGLLGGGLFGGGGGSASPDDQNGHGTHCAGIIGALDNTIGSKGVAYGAEVVAVQVLGSNGSGSTSVIIQGVDYVAANARPGEVANMSLGGGVNTSLDNAVINASNRGIWFVLAAGNSSANANNSSPARANGTYILTISSMDSQDRLSSFSNFANPPIDFAEPGSSIYSTYRNGGYSTLSGTSMAAPHAAGLILLRGGKPAAGGFITGDRDNTPDVIGVR